MSRVVIGFFGLTRSLSFTLPWIERKLLAPLRAYDPDLYSCGHFNLPEFIHNPRSGETGTKPDPSEGRRLNLQHFEVEEQLIGNIAPYLKVIKKFPDPFQDNYQSLTFLCYQLYSLNRLWQHLAAKITDETKFVVLARPDLAYFDQINPEEIEEKLQKSDWLVPNWGHWEGGINDRFLCARPKAAEFYATRLGETAEATIAGHGLHSERFVRYVAQKHGLHVGEVALRAVRVRVSGQIPDLDRWEQRLAAKNLTELNSYYEADREVQREPENAIPFPQRQWECNELVKH